MYFYFVSMLLSGALLSFYGRENWVYTECWFCYRLLLRITLAIDMFSTAVNGYKRNQDRIALKLS